MAVFSSAPSSVPRGLLFSLYPDYHALGRALGALAVAEGDSQGIEFLTSTRAALNLRTARHLGADLAPAVRERFQLLFPTPP